MDTLTQAMVFLQPRVSLVKNKVSYLINAARSYWTDERKNSYHHNIMGVMSVRASRLN